MHKRKVTRHQINGNLIFEDKIRIFTDFLEQYTRDRKVPINSKDEPNLSLLLKLSGLTVNVKNRHIFLETAKAYADKFGKCASKSAREEFFLKKEREFLQERPKMTYQQLLEMDLDVTQRSKAHYLSSIRRFIRFLELDAGEEIGKEFFENLEGNLAQFVEREYKNDYGRSRASVSAIRKWHSIYLLHVREDGLPASLQGALSKLIENSGRSKKEISRAIGKNDGYIYSITSGTVIHPLASDMANVESLLSAPKGTLTKRLSKYSVRRNGNFCDAKSFPEELRGHRYSILRRRVRDLLPEEYPLLSEIDRTEVLARCIKEVENSFYADEYRRRQSKNTSLKYVLKAHDTTEEIERQISELTLMKKSRGGYDKVYPRDRWNTNTAKKTRNDLLKFLGFCHLPPSADKAFSGLGIPLENLTLGLIGIREIVDAYFDFCKARSGGEYSMTIRNSMAIFISILSPDKGWLSNSPYVSQNIPKEYMIRYSENKSWKEICKEQFDYLNLLIGSLEYKVQRNSFLPIMPLIETGRPADYLKLALKSARKELEEVEDIETGSLGLSLKWRDYILISLLSRIPFRARNWCEMKYISSHNSQYRIDNGSNVRRVNSVDWLIYIAAKDFKNSKNRSIFGNETDKDVKLVFKEIGALKELERDFEYYMECIRPNLCKGDGPVFPNREGRHMTSYELNYIVNAWTRQYLSEYSRNPYGLRIKGIRSFGPHAFRHIIASHIVINTGNFEAAANLLLDNVETVEKHYGHLAPSQRIAAAFLSYDVWPSSVSDSLK